MGNKVCPCFNSIHSLYEKIPHSSENNVHYDLTENEINILLENTRMDREQIIDYHKQFIVENPSGVIDKNKFITMFNDLLHSNNDITKRKVDRFAEYVFK
jgi:Ca2+-binding EF-hand superfamily protein